MVDTIIHVVLLIAIGLILNVIFTIIKQRKSDSLKLKVKLIQLIPSTLVLIGCLIVLYY